MKPAHLTPKALRWLAAGMAGLLVLGTAALAQEHSGHFGPGGARFGLDERFHHDHYYPAHGYVALALPHGAVSVAFRGGSYWFHGGVWYRPWGTRYVVVAAPVGIVVPVLPPAFVTISIAGVTYFYANGTYYTEVPGSGYTVVAPPPGAETAQPVTTSPVQPAPPPPKPAPPPEPIIYPRNGQSPAQTEADRVECNRWATTQPAAMADASVFQRAVAACMDGRGYTLR